MKNLHLHLKFKWFDQIESGKKKTEYRIYSKYWIKVFFNNPDGFEKIVLYRGFAGGGKIERPWKGYDIKVITHPEWNNVPQKCFCIPVN